MQEAEYNQKSYLLSLVYEAFDGVELEDGISLHETVGSGNQMHTPLMVADEGDIYELLDRYTNYDEETSGPEARWDYFGISRNPIDFFQLKQPKKLRKFFGLIPAGETSQCPVAKKSEIVQEGLLSNPPAALFLDDVLYECPIDCDDESLSNWTALFRDKFMTIAEGRTLQMVDAHS